MAYYQIGQTSGTLASAESVFGHDPKSTYAPGGAMVRTASGSIDIVGYARSVWQFAAMDVSTFDSAKTALFSDDGTYSGEGYVETRDDNDDNVASDCVINFPDPRNLRRWGEKYLDVTIEIILLDAGSPIPWGGGALASYATETFVTNAIATHALDNDAHHDPITLASDIDTNLLSLSTQELDLDAQSANEIFAGPTTGGDAKPTFRALVGADIPAATESAVGGLEIATIAEAQAGSLDTKIITPALLRTRELDIAELLFTEDDGLLLLGPGCPMTPDAWTSLRGQEAAISGAFHQVAGRWAGTRALMIEEGTTNYIKNPAFREGVASDWSVQDSGSSSGNASDYTSDYLISDSCARFNGTVDGSYPRLRSAQTGLSVTSGDEVILTYYAKSLVSGESMTAAIELSGSSKSTSSVTPNTSRWTRYQVTWTADGAGDIFVHFRLGSSSTDVLIDGVQVENLSYPTSYCDGDQGSGYSWGGTPDASISSRAQTLVSVPDAASFLGGRSAYSIRCVLQVQYDYDDSWPNATLNALFNSDVTDIMLYYDAGNNRFKYLVDGSNRVTADVIPFSRGDWLDIVITGAGEMYLNGNQIGTGSAVSIPALVNFFIASRNNGAYNSNLIFSEVSIFDRNLTAAEIAALYAAGHPLTDQGAIKSPVDNLGPLAGAWPILFGSQTHTGDTSYSEAGSNQESRFGWGTWVSGALQFEAVLKISDAGDTGYAKLQWNDSGTWRDVAGSEVSITGGTSADLVRSGAIYLSPDEREYRVAIKTSDSSQTVTVYKATLICMPGGLSEI